MKTDTTTTKDPSHTTTKGDAIKPLVRATTVAKALNVHRRTVELWAQRGTIPVVKFGTTLRFDLDQVLASAK